jgi:uncharacterized Ntn-hydrolase superfamily protein
MTPSAACLTLVTLLGLVAGTPRPASATWSIVAVDPRTREVGAAGASCTPFVVGIVGLAPGRGAIVVQAMSNPMARVRGVEMLNDGATPAAIIRALREPQFDPENQQYGVAALGADSGAAYTGTAAYAESATAHGVGVAVQGNTLPSKEVVHAAMAAFRAAADSGFPLAERLLRALEAGSAAGGDRRCGRQTAHSAFLGVAHPGDAPRNPYVRLVIPDQEDTGINPVHLLRREWDRQRAQAAADEHDVVRARIGSASPRVGAYTAGPTKGGEMQRDRPVPSRLVQQRTTIRLEARPPLQVNGKSRIQGVASAARLSHARPGLAGGQREGGKPAIPGGRRGGDHRSG